MAKALGNGGPIGACWARAEVAGVFEPGDHATTYGGQPLATAAARAVLDVMQAEDVPARAAAAGERFREGLGALADVRDIRGRGLLLAVELDSQSIGRPAGEVAAGLLAGRWSSDDDTSPRMVVNAVTPTALRLAPSLLITDAEIDLAVDTLAAALTATDTGRVDR
jgi:acetylornithine/succinyldiaminopimelate/putrescine aminotransferase